MFVFISLLCALCLTGAVNSCFVKPRDWVTWKVCQPQVSPTYLLLDHAINQSVLTGPSGYSSILASSPTCHSSSPLPSSSPTWLASPLSPIDDLDDMEDIFPEKTVAPSLSEPADSINVIDTNFDVDKNLSALISYRASHEEKFKFTEEQRQLAKNAVTPTSFEDLKNQVCIQFLAALYIVVIIYACRFQDNLSQEKRSHLPVSSV